MYTSNNFNLRSVFPCYIPVSDCGLCTKLDRFNIGFVVYSTVSGSKKFQCVDA